MKGKKWKVKSEKYSQRVLTAGYVGEKWKVKNEKRKIELFIFKN